jgi:hypothetical protein
MMVLERMKNNMEGIQMKLSILLGLSLFFCAAAMGAKSGQWEVFETSFKSTKDYANAFTELHPSGHQC